MIRSQLPFILAYIFQWAFSIQQTRSEILERRTYSDRCASSLLLHKLGYVLQGVRNVLSYTGRSKSVKNNFFYPVPFIQFIEPLVKIASHSIFFYEIPWIAHCSVSINLVGIAYVITYWFHEAFYRRVIKSILIDSFKIRLTFLVEDWSWIHFTYSFFKLGSTKFYRLIVTFRTKSFIFHIGIFQTGQLLVRQTTHGERSICGIFNFGSCFLRIWRLCTGYFRSFTLLI